MPTDDEKQMALVYANLYPKQQALEKLHQTLQLPDLVIIGDAEEHFEKAYKLKPEDVPAFILKLAAEAHIPNTGC